MSWLLYTGDADANRAKYVAKINDCKKRVRKNFKEMDLENASARNEIEIKVEKIVKECESLVSRLEGI